MTVLYPTIEKFLSSLAGQPPISTLPVKKARKFLETLQSHPLPHTRQRAKIEDITIPYDHHRPISIRIVRPASYKTGLLPIVMYFHGAGWILGSKHVYDRLIRQISNEAHAAVVFVNFTRSPEAQFPIALEQLYYATKYISDHGLSMNLDPTKLAVFGDSVGGNMAIGVTLLSKQRQGPHISQQILFYPVTNCNFNTPSYKKYANGPWLTKKSMQWFWDAYEPDHQKRKSILMSPLRASLDDLNGLPPCLLITDENDVLRDEGEAYGRKLIKAGVPVTAIRYAGLMHDFAMLNALSEIPAVKNAVNLATTTLRDVFDN